MSDKTFIEDIVVLELHKNLMADKARLDYLEQTRGIKKETVVKYFIGHDEKTARYTIPIKDAFGNWVNIRRWKNETPKMISYAQGYGESRLYPIDNLKDGKNKVVICEGEWDCLLLNQEGINAVTGTTGVNTWLEEWNVFFKHFDVMIIFDCDDVGRAATLKVKEQLLHNVKSLKILDLKLGNDGEDITDFFVKHKKTVKDLREIVKNTPFEDMYEYIDLANGMESTYFGKHIKFNGMVIGKDLSPYIIPLRVMARCKTGSHDSKICQVCTLGNGPTITRTYDYAGYKDLLIKMVGSNDKQVKGFIRQDLGLPNATSCPGIYDIDILERQNIEDIQVIPEIDFELINQEYVIRRCYYFGIGCNTNANYLVKGTTWAHPNTQMGIHLVQEVEGNRDNISSFVLTDEVKRNLKIFQPGDQHSKLSIMRKLEDIYTDLTFNVTKMYQREALIMATDLVYHSVLSFYFIDKLWIKGWVECAIIGDTKCGKTETVRNIVRHYKAGEFLTSGENTTLAGILGGVQQINDRWIVTWGKLPLNDRRAVVVDEADNLAELGILGKLSGVRSSGIAEIVKIQPQRTMARTRIIWIANPIYGKMNEKNYGIETVKDIFNKQQDISRIDFCIGVAREDIGDDVINIIHKEKVEHVYTSEACHEAVMFAWSREPQHIKWEKGVEQYILDLSNKFGEKYSPAIPVVIGAEMRIKLARLAVALACRLYSTDETGENVIVTQAHVDVVSEFLQKVYDGSVLGYRDYSDQRRREKSVGDTTELEKHINDNEETINMLLDMNKIQLNDLSDIFGIDGKKELTELIKELRMSRLLKKVNTFYIKTSACIEFLKFKREEIRTKLKKKDDGISSGDKLIDKVFFGKEE